MVRLLLRGYLKNSAELGFEVSAQRQCLVRAALSGGPRGEGGREARSWRGGGGGEPLPPGAVSVVLSVAHRHACGRFPPPPPVSLPHSLRSDALCFL